LLTLRCQTAKEKTLQDALGPMLRASFSTVRREVKLSPRETIDFLVGDVGIETKVDGSWTAVTRQILRYLEHDAVKSLVLVTTKRQHLQVPSVLLGKSVLVAWLSPF
jgi:hypothetical protein